MPHIFMYDLEHGERAEVADKEGIMNKKGACLLFLSNCFIIITLFLFFFLFFSLWFVRFVFVCDCHLYINK